MAGINVATTDELNAVIKRVEALEAAIKDSGVPVLLRQYKSLRSP